MDHAYECLTPCRACAGRGWKERQHGKRKVRKQCKGCAGTGDCRRDDGHPTEWRGPNPPSAPCQERDCCVCGKTPCRELWCRLCCYEDADGQIVRNEGDTAWPCSLGSCPSCGGSYVEWLSFEVAPADVYLNMEVLVPRPARAIPSKVSVSR